MTVVYHLHHTYGTWPCVHEKNACRGGRDVTYVVMAISNDDLSNYVGYGTGVCDELYRAEESDRHRRATKGSYRKKNITKPRKAVAARVPRRAE